METDFLYNRVLNIEFRGIHEINEADPLDQLKKIKEEVLTRIKITKQEIFKIGQLLSMAKPICKQAGTSFQDWIEMNFDFSLKTANNFMNVFKQCMGINDLALHIPTSILYQISSPSFPAELRDYLITNGNLERITNGKFTKLLAKYKEGGFEAIEKDMAEINRTYTMERHY